MCALPTEPLKHCEKIDVKFCHNIIDVKFCHSIINPQRACAARVTVVVMSVCLSVTPLERLFVLKTLSHTQRAAKVKKFVGFSLKPLRCRDPALPPLYGHAYSRPFFSCTRMRISRVYTRMIHRRGFSTLVLFIFSHFSISQYLFCRYSKSIVTTGWRATCLPLPAVRSVPRTAPLNPVCLVSAAAGAALM